jgi:hypothetical protein
MYMATMWSVTALGVIPIGAVCLLLLLSDIRSFQKIAISVTSVQIALGALKMTLSLIFALFATVLFGFQSYTVFHHQSTSQHHATSPGMTVEMLDRLRMKEWRNDRNWWISLCACFIWLLVWRIQVWTKRYCLVAHLATPTQATNRVPSKENKKKE